MWGVFPTQLLSLNPILHSESRNSKNSGIFLESLESLYKSLKSGHFGQMGHHFHSILGPGFDSEVRIEKFQRFWSFGIFWESLESGIGKCQNLWNFSILTSESNPGLKIEWK